MNKQTNTQHTPTPYNLMEGRTLVHLETDQGNAAGAGIPICSFPIAKKAEAMFVLRACNAHDDLVAALRAYLDADQTMSPEWQAQARAALAKAGAA